MDSGNTGQCPGGYNIISSFTFNTCNTQGSSTTAPCTVSYCALTYTGNPKMEDDKTRYARFAGTYDRAARKWIASEAKRTKDYDVLSGAYSVRSGENIFVAPNGDQGKVPPEFIGLIVKTEEEKEQHLDEEMNKVYKAVRVMLQPALFAKVKQDQIAWLKKRDAIPVGQRSGIIVERTKALSEFLWR